MSSLQCPARVFVARHGQAQRPAGSDDGGLTDEGRAQALALAAELRSARISRVWTSSMARAAETAEIVAAELGVGVAVRDGLREYAADEPAEALAARVTEVLEEVADEHRGEAVLVVTHGGALLAALAPLAGIPAERLRERSLPPCAAVELEADGERWSVTSWGGG